MVTTSNLILIFDADEKIHEIEDKKKPHEASEKDIAIKRIKGALIDNRNFID